MKRERKKQEQKNEQSVVAATSSLEMAAIQGKGKNCFLNQKRLKIHCRASICTQQVNLARLQSHKSHHEQRSKITCSPKFEVNRKRINWRSKTLMLPRDTEIRNLHFWGLQWNKGEDGLSSPDKHIHLSQSAEQCHLAQALSHMLWTARVNKESMSIYNKIRTDRRSNFNIEKKMVNLENQNLLVQ